MSSNYAIDSLTILIKEEFVNIKNEELNARVALINVDTGEQLTNPREKADLIVENIGFNTHYKIQGRSIVRRHSDAIVERYVSFTANSKHLKELYFEGITRETLPRLYEQIISENVIEFSFEDLLNAIVWDVDVRKDFSKEDFKVNEFKEAVGKLKQALKPEFKKISKTFRAKDNQGFQVSDRKSVSDPFYKLYNKAVELMYNSSEFWNKYLNRCEVENEYRIEITFKRRKQMMTLGLLKEDDIATLDNILTSVETRAASVFKSTQARYFMGLEDYQARQKLIGENDKIMRKALNTVTLYMLNNQHPTLDAATEWVVKCHEPSKNMLSKFKIASMHAYHALEEMMTEDHEKADLKLW